MSDQNDVLKLLYDNNQRLKQTETREVPGAAPGFTAFYVTGTFVPTFVGTTIAGTYTYTSQAGRYARIGNRVFFEFDIAISAISVNPTGNMTIAGLPIASSASATFGPVTLGFISNIDYPAGKLAITALVPGGGLQRINLYTSTDNAGGALYPAASFTNVNCELTGGGHYEV